MDSAFASHLTWVLLAFFYLHIVKTRGDEGQSGAMEMAIVIKFFTIYDIA